MKLLVTGLSGFVGGWIRDLVTDDPQWRDVSLLPADGYDLLDRDSLDALVTARRPDAVLHLAASSSVAEAIRDPVATANVNVIGTLHLLDALEAAGFTGRFLHVGSSEEYGRVEAETLPVAETAPLEPRNPYAASKAAAEMFVLERVRRGKLDAVLARPFNHTGPRQDSRFVLPSLARQVAEIALRRRPPAILAGDLDITRDFLDVRDVATAYLTLLLHGKCGGIYNVCSGHESRLVDLLASLLRLAGTSADVQRDPALLRPAEQRRVCGENARLRALGWAPRYSLEQTLLSLLDYWKELIAKEMS